MLERIKISSHCLKTLYLRKCNKLVEVEIDTPKLCKLTHSGHNTISFSVKKLKRSAFMRMQKSWRARSLVILDKVLSCNFNLFIM